MIVGKPVTEVKIIIEDKAIRVEWGIEVTNDRWLWPTNRTMEVRLYCHPFMDFGMPRLLSSSLGDKQLASELSGGFSFFNVLAITKNRVKSRSAFRAGFPSADLRGRFFPVELDLDDDDIPLGCVRAYPTVVWPVSDNSDIRSKTFLYWITFCAHTTFGIEVVYESDVIEQNGDRQGSELESRSGYTNIPPMSRLFTGRTKDIARIKARMGISSNADSRLPQTIIRGWPGVGKTTLITTLANDREVKSRFSDGVFWAVLGEHPKPLDQLATWGRLLGVNDLLSYRLQDATDRMREIMSNRRALLIIDDIWNVEDAIPLLIAGASCFTMATTRFGRVANNLANFPNEVYALEILDIDEALDLFHLLAPRFVNALPSETRTWLENIERLPLAIVVGARLFEREMSLGVQAAANLLERVDLLRAAAPIDRHDPESGKIPTVETLLQASTNLLDSDTRAAFSCLGWFAPKPATFDLSAMEAICQIKNPRDVALNLMDLGLLEPIQDTGRFWMHALLVMHAKSLADDATDGI